MMKPSEELHASVIGHIAHQVLTRCSVADVIGKTKQGVFLDPKGDLLLFLTRDPYRGPLTINIIENLGSLHKAKIGESAIFTGNELMLLESGINIEVVHHPIWKPPQPLNDRYHPQDQYSFITERVKPIFPDHPYLFLLEFAATGEPIPRQNYFCVAGQIVHLSQALETRKLKTIFMEAEMLLGSGPGLTPLADDLLLGVLLTISRTLRKLHWEGNIPLFFQALLQAAEMRTTKISCCLLNCAVQGSADERILRVLDNLIAAEEIRDRDLYELLHWGSSSRIAVLGGMILGLRSLFPKQNPQIRSPQACQIPSRN